MLLSVAPQNAVKLFSFLLYIHILRILISARKPELDSKYIVIPLLLLPVPWILLHIVNPDLLNSFFFVAAICTLHDANTDRSIALSAVLLAFTCWTKYTMYPYLIVLPLLFWRRQMPFRLFVRRAFLFVVVFLMLLSPIYVRNIVLKKDPLYPLLYTVFPSDWQHKQTVAVQTEFPLPATLTEFAKRIILTPISITFQLRSYGSASEIGFLPLLGLIFLPFTFRKSNIRLLLFLFLCYLIWIHQLYHFRYFLPIYLIGSLLLAYSFQFIGMRLRRIVPVIWVLAAAYGLYISIPVARLFPLISTNVTREQYLSGRISYFEAAQYLNSHAKGERTIMVGETRNAYIRAKLIPFSYTDPDPLLRWSSKVKNAEELYRKLKQEQVGYILYNRAEMKRLADQYGIWRASSEQNAMIAEMLRAHGKIVFSKSGAVVIRIR